MQQYYDMVVVGAGPAGSVAARFAAENGLSALILERDREPGIPVRCAEGVSHNGIAPFIDIDKRWIASAIEVAKLHSPDGNCATMYNNGKGYVLERRLFDTALSELACKHGAELLLKANATGLTKENGKISGVEFTHLGEKKQVNCKIVIAADGVESRVARWAGIKTDVSLSDIDTCVQYTLTNIDVEEEACHFYFGTKIAPGGYIWIFPKSKHKANVGIGITGTYAEAKRPKAYLDEFVEQYFPKAKISYQVYGGVPTANTLKEICTDNFMVVGDAARQVNPITGGGIVQGMIAGKIAALVAVDAIKQNDLSANYLRRYHEEWNKKIGNAQKTMYSMKGKFLSMNDNSFNRLVEICNKIPRDKFSLKELFFQAVKGDPVLMTKVVKAFVISKMNK
jgi:digeranylgeranylglycerophospholipid reductase